MCVWRGQVYTDWSDHCRYFSPMWEEVAARQRPEFLISSDFEFDKLSSTPDYALAQSLFSHLPKPAMLSTQMSEPGRKPP